MIEKYLIRFCAQEVRTMITRLHERPDDFDYGTRWRDLAETRSGFTWVERKVLDCWALSPTKCSTQPRKTDGVA
jgi:hypothetical protein